MSLKAPPPTDGDRAEVERAGLCASCAHLQVLRSKRSTFVRCALADLDPRFDRYPRLPVGWCRGHEPTESSGDGNSRE